MRISDWSSDVCSSDLMPLSVVQHPGLVMLGNRLPTAFADVGCCFWLATLPAKLLKPQPLAVVAMRARHEVAALVRRVDLIGRAACRERGGQYVEISVIAVAFKKKTSEKHLRSY